MFLLPETSARWSELCDNLEICKNSPYKP